MPVMSSAERWFCQSPPWRWIAGRLILGWAMQGVSPRGAVLELGGGSGAMAAATIRRHPGCAVTVTDVDPAMVAAAQRRFANEPRVTVRQADATALPFADGSFNVVVSYLMLHHVIAWQQALGEVPPGAAARGALRRLRPPRHTADRGSALGRPLTAPAHRAPRAGTGPVAGRPSGRRGPPDDRSPSRALHRRQAALTPPHRAPWRRAPPSTGSGSVRPPRCPTRWPPARNAATSSRRPTSR